MNKREIYNKWRLNIRGKTSATKQYIALLNILLFIFIGTDNKMEIIFHISIR